MTAPGWPATLAQPDFLVRPLAAADAAAWREARGRNAAWLDQWEATMPPGASGGPTTHRDAVRRLRQLARAGQSLPFALDVGGVFRGQVTVSNVLRGSAQLASIGYWIDRDVAGRGIMPRAVAMVIDHCFGPVGLHRIEIAIRPENRNSLRVVEKLGLAEVGYAPRYLHINGAWRDHRLFAITREEAPGGVLARVVAG